ncbi:MAG: hypothetical protein MJZ41_07645 [Bacteroidaceae bacterium]|nr:hypothetical protein [Bacteroidaceae bacterium]
MTEQNENQQVNEAPAVEKKNESVASEQSPKQTFDDLKVGDIITDGENHISVYSGQSKQYIYVSSHFVFYNSIKCIYIDTLIEKSSELRKATEIEKKLLSEFTSRFTSICQE